jgi:hypothetical protein
MHVHIIKEKANKLLFSKNLQITTKRVMYRKISNFINFS